MSNGGAGFWGPVSALAGVVGVILTYVIWQDEKARDPGDDPTGAWTDEYWTEEAGAGDGVSGEWVLDRTFQVDLAPTYADGECLEAQIDLDDGGYSETVAVGGPYADWMDVIWSSCGGEYGVVYGRLGDSATVYDGGSADVAACTGAIGADTYLEFRFEPAYPTTDEGCLFTGTGAVAAATVDSVSSDGSFAYGRLNIAVYTWV
ncbi:hypothetical protein [Glycomyces terrestris]|uniref:Uncharacterized protein n=1 Tax=Glycomyces terrestris TaxID=2493553 RepID=A0A426US00_9ACTN|nr:hypothetical protein [Glycomyces terrestris]RRR96078.1 hypothetical protein EIW28_22710 [Glycomyces terrestris]